MKTTAIFTMMVPVTHTGHQDPETLAGPEAAQILAFLGDVHAVGLFSYPQGPGRTVVDTSVTVTMDTDASEACQAEFVAKDRTEYALALTGLEHGEVTAVAFPEESGDPRQAS